MLFSEVPSGALSSAHSAAEPLLQAILTYVGGPCCLQLRRCLQLPTLITFFHSCLCSFFAASAHPLGPYPEMRRMDVLPIRPAEVTPTWISKAKGKSCLGNKGKAFGGGFCRCLRGNLQTSRNIFRPRVYPITERGTP